MLFSRSEDLTTFFCSVMTICMQLNVLNIIHGGEKRVSGGGNFHLDVKGSIEKGTH